jgi:hypothetical protein
MDNVVATFAMGVNDPTPASGAKLVSDGLPSIACCYTVSGKNRFTNNEEKA